MRSDQVIKYGGMFLGVSLRDKLMGETPGNTYITTKNIFKSFTMEDMS